MEVGVEGNIHPAACPYPARERPSKPAALAPCALPQPSARSAADDAPPEAYGFCSASPVAADTAAARSSNPGGKA